jgi:aminoglycoside phosphotransferase
LQFLGQYFPHTKIHHRQFVCVEHRQKCGNQRLLPILKDFRLNGFVDCAEAGIADRYQDIALLARSVGHNFGEKWIPFVFECLEIEPDWEKIEFYKLLDEFF